MDCDLDIEPFHYEDVYQISAPIAPLNCGGPLDNRKKREVLGIKSEVMRMIREKSIQVKVKRLKKIEKDYIY